MKWRQLTDWQGTLGRRACLLLGTLLFTLKWNLDRFVLPLWRGGKTIRIEDYFQAGYPASDWLTLDEIRAGGWMLLLVALPFLWAGVVLTVQRLRSARLPLALAVLFVVPVLKWFLFLVALAAPARDASAPPPMPGLPPPTWLQRLCPRSRLGSATAAVIFTCALMWSAVLLGTMGLEHYGWGLFLGLPFVAGFAAAFIHGAHEPRSLRASLGVASLAVIVAALGFVALAIEGIVCVLMATPLALPLAMIGALLGHLIAPARWRRGAPEVFCASVLAVPCMLSAERLADAPAPLLEVKSSVEIAAPPARVWQHVVAFSELPPPTELIFRLGIAYPQRAEIFGHGAGAVRHCVFSTGPFVEPIEVWDEPRLLRFGVTQNPPPMQEWTPYHDVHPPHLSGFLASERGQFALHELPGDRTRLEGTTWYRHHLWPVDYWQLWSDAIIHRIHLRVLHHIQERAEAAAPSP